MHHNVAHIINTKGDAVFAPMFAFTTFDVGNSTDLQLWIVHTLQWMFLFLFFAQGELTLGCIRHSGQLRLSFVALQITNIYKCTFLFIFVLSMPSNSADIGRVENQNYCHF